MRYFDQENIIGIPDRSIKRPLPSLPRHTTNFVVQRHVADKAGEHLDLRLSLNGIGFSWAGRYWPAVGEKVLMVRQPDHTTDYFDFEGEIRDGYGKGMVHTFKKDKIEVIKSSPEKVTFYVYPGGQLEKYSLINTGGDNWVLLNHTSSKEIERLGRPKYKSYKDLTGKYIKQESDLLLPKIDGAHGVMVLRPEKSPIVLSKRISKKNKLPIEYTPKIESLLNKFSPKTLGTTVLRGEVHGAMPNRILGGVLNAGVWKSREMQKHFGPIQYTAFDVVKFKGKDVSSLPYQDRLNIIDEVKKEFPYINSIKNAPPSPEGFVVWRNNQPHKLKNRLDMDVYVKNIFPSIVGERAGGFEYSLSPRGKVVGKVGTGFTHDELREMNSNPDKYIGQVARVFALEKHPSGALRAPSFYEWHKEKNI